MNIEINDQQKRRELESRIASTIFNRQVEKIRQSPAVERIYETAAFADAAGELDSWQSFLEKIFPKPSFEEFQGAKTKVWAKITEAIKNHEAKAT